MRLRLPTICVLALVLVTAGLLAGGCGDDEQELPDDIAGVCNAVADRFAEIQELPLSSWESALERTEALREVAAEGDAALTELAPEAPDAESYAAYLDSRAKVAARLEQALDAAEARKVETYEAARAAANEGAGERRRLAEAAGLPGCAGSTGL